MGTSTKNSSPKSTALTMRTRCGPELQPRFSKPQCQLSCARYKSMHRQASIACVRPRHVAVVKRRIVTP